MKISKFIQTVLLLTLPVIIIASQSDKFSNSNITKSQSVDNTTYINANKILMFVTNHGNFGRDLGGVFGKDYGTFYPYVDNESIENGILNKSVNYASGLWLGGKVNGSIRISASEYVSDFVPGPMENGTFMTDRPEFKVYKLYADSLESNPNDDYLNWPVDQGAPMNDQGKPAMMGEQMLWSVFNDADPNQHINFLESPFPLGIEVQMTTWAQDEDGNDTIYIVNELNVIPFENSELFVKVLIVDNSQITGDEYYVISGEDGFQNGIYSLINKTTGETLFTDQPISYSPIIDGFQIFVINDLIPTFESFEVVANASGALAQPVSAGLVSQGYPTPNGSDPDDTQQVGDGKWLIATGDNGGTNGGGTRGSYAAFLGRTFRDDASRIENLGAYDWEMRFTGDNSNPGVGGGYAISAFTAGVAFWVPFELWRTGIGTPDDPSDDLRLIPWIFDDGGDSLYYLSSYGSDADGTCGPGGCEHSASDGDDDPYTDWVYWKIPVDANDNEFSDGYQIFEDSAIADPTMANWAYKELAVMDRTVLINWNGGVQPPFTQDMPEMGTVFRMRTGKNIPVDTNSFVATPSNHITSGPDGTSIYIKYKLYNKGGNQIDSCYFSIWSDPDLGWASDDVVGCDTLNNIHFCYNQNNNDQIYGERPPALGYKIIHGPLVPAQGESAFFEGNIIQDFKNLGMTSFIGYHGTDDPNDAEEAFQNMKGFYAYGSDLPYVYNNDTLSFMSSGDPVTGFGDISNWNTHMVASTGPFTFNPGDSQYVMIKMAVGQGVDRLSSLTRLIEILNVPFQLPTDVKNIEPKELPKRFYLSQNYPNPFNPTTSISYSLPEKSKVKLEIFNILGQKIITLVDETKPAGNYKTVWDGKNENNKIVSSGVYFYKLTAGDFIDKKKMVLLK